MTLEMSIPALLFPAISLTMLAYNARYLAIASLIRQLHKEFLNHPSESIRLQINQLRKRLYLIRNMQASALLLPWDFYILKKLASQILFSD